MPQAIWLCFASPIPERSSLTRLAFDIRNDSHAGAGAPRFNVYTKDVNGNFGVSYFYGAAYGTRTAVNANWTHVEFSESDGVPSDGAGPDVAVVETEED